MRVRLKMRVVIPLTQRPAKAQRQAEFTAWVTPYLEMLYRTAWRFTGHRQDAEDLLQELLLRLYQKPHTWAALDNPRPWLTRTLHNLFVDQWRHTRHTPLNNRDDQPWDELLSSTDSPETGPEYLAQSQSVQQRLHRALARLPPAQRAIVILHDLEGHTVNELMVLLDLPSGTVKSRLFRAHRHLRAAFLTRGNPTARFDVLDRELNEI